MLPLFFSQIGSNWSIKGENSRHFVFFSSLKSRLLNFQTCCGSSRWAQVDVIILVFAILSLASGWLIFPRVLLVSFSLHPALRGDHLFGSKRRRSQQSLDVVVVDHLPLQQGVGQLKTSTANNNNKSPWKIKKVIFEERTIEKWSFLACDL